MEQQQGLGSWTDDGSRRRCNLARDEFLSDLSHLGLTPSSTSSKVKIKARSYGTPTASGIYALNPEKSVGKKDRKFAKKMVKVRKERRHDCVLFCCRRFIGNVFVMDWSILFDLNSSGWTSISSLADSMDHGDSSRSLLSERSSDVGSHYVMESGFYISSFAAIIFVSGLVIAGALLLSLLIALIIMLQSCQNQNSCVFQQWRKDYVHDYCNIFAFHKELNNLESEEFPTACKAYLSSYINGGQYLLELNMSVLVAENYFSTVTPDNSLSVVLMDADDILPPDIIDELPPYRNELEKVKGLGQGFVRRLYMKLQTGGWSLILFTRKQENQRNGTVDSLIAAGYEGWSSLIMRSKNELSMGSWEYISSRRVELHDLGFTIVSVISSRLDALTGPSMGKRNFKLASGLWL